MDPQAARPFNPGLDSRLEYMARRGLRVDYPKCLRNVLRGFLQIRRVAYRRIGRYKLRKNKVWSCLGGCLPSLYRLDLVGLLCG